jgi:uncharacterized protein
LIRLTLLEGATSRNRAIGVQFVHRGGRTIFEWDPIKAEANFRKHGVRFAEAQPVFADDFAIMIPDDGSDPLEQRFISIGKGARLRVLVVVYCYRGGNIRIVSARLAEPHERAQFEEQR